MEGESHPYAIAKLRRMISYLASYRRSRPEHEFVWPEALHALPSGGLRSGSATTQQLLSRLTAVATEWCCKMACDLADSIDEDMHRWSLTSMPSVIVVSLAEAAAAAKRIVGRSTREFFSIDISDWPDDEHQSQACSSLLRAAEMEACSLDIDLCIGPAALQSPGRLLFERGLASCAWTQFWQPGRLRVRGLRPRVAAAWLAAEAAEEHSAGGVLLQVVIEGPPVFFPRPPKGVLVLQSGESVAGGECIKVDFSHPQDTAAAVEELLELLCLLRRWKTPVELECQTAVSTSRVDTFEFIRKLDQLIQGRMPELSSLSLDIRIRDVQEAFHEDFLVEAARLVADSSRWTVQDVSISCWETGLENTSELDLASSLEAQLRNEALLTAVGPLFVELKNALSLSKLKLFCDAGLTDSPKTHLLAVSLLAAFLDNSASLLQASYATPIGTLMTLSCNENSLLQEQSAALQMAVRSSPADSPMSQVADDFGGAASFAFEVLKWLRGCGAEQQVRRICGLSSLEQGDWGMDLDVEVSWSDGPPPLCSCL